MVLVSRSAEGLVPLAEAEEDVSCFDSDLGMAGSRPMEVLAVGSLPEGFAHRRVVAAVVGMRTDGYGLGIAVDSAAAATLTIRVVPRSLDGP